MADKPYALTYRFNELADAVETPVELFNPRHGTANSYAAKALWDTGAMLSVVSPEIAAKLNLAAVDAAKIEGITGIGTADIVDISVRFPNGAVIKNLRAAVCKFSSETEAILGMDAITQMDFAITNSGNQTQFSFVLPPLPDKIDFEKQAGN
jgi:hypothetical protein